MSRFFERVERCLAHITVRYASHCDERRYLVDCTRLWNFIDSIDGEDDPEQLWDLMLDWVPDAFHNVDDYLSDDNRMICAVNTLRFTYYDQVDAMTLPEYKRLTAREIARAGCRMSPEQFSNHVNTVELLAQVDDRRPEILDAMCEGID